MIVIEVKSKTHSIHNIFIDGEDFDKIKDYKWHISNQHNHMYVTCKSIQSSNKIYMHRLIMGSPVNKIVDHINGNGLDNRKVNLRVCSIKENVRNSYKIKINCFSIYKGVSFCKKSNKWYSYITSDYKKYHLGCFNSEIEAAKAYDKAALYHFGEFSNLNII